MQVRMCWCVGSAPFDFFARKLTVSVRVFDYNK